MHELPNIYQIDQLVDYYIEQLLIIDGYHYYLTHSADNVLLFSNAACQVKYVVMQLFAEQQCFVLSGYKSASSVEQLLNTRNNQQSKEEIRENVQISVKKSQPQTVAKLQTQFLRKSVKFEKQKFLLIAYFNNECPNFQRILHYLYQIQSLNKEVYVVVQIAGITFEALEYIDSYFKDQMNFLSDDGQSALLASEGFFFQLFMNEIQGHKIIGEGYTLEKMLQDVRKIAVLTKIQDVLFIDQRIVFFGIPIVLSRCLVNSQTLLLCFKETFSEEEISVLAEICRHVSVYLINCQQKVGIHEFGLGGNNGICKKLPQILGSDARFVQVQSGVASCCKLDSFLQSVVQKRIMFTHEYFLGIFKKLTDGDYIEAHQFRTVANDFPDAQYQIKKAIDAFGRNLIDFEEYKQILVDAKFDPYEKVEVVEEESTHLSLTQQKQIKKEKTMEEIENLKLVIKQEPVVMLKNIKSAVLKIGLQIDLNREYFARNELLVAVDILKCQLEDQEAEFSNTDEPQDTTGKIQYRAAQTTFFNLSYGQERCQPEALAIFFQMNGVPNEEFWAFVRERGLKFFSFVAFWKLMQVKQIKIKLKDVMKHGAQKHHKTQKVDNYFFEYARFLFQQTTKDQVMTKQDCQQLLKEYGFKIKVPSESFTFVTFVDLLKDEKIDQQMLKADEQKMLKGMFETYEAGGVICKEMIFRIGEIENISSMKICEVLAKYPHKYANFEQFYMIMKEAGWRIVW